MPDDFYISIKVPYKKALACRTYLEWERTVQRAMEDAKWRHKTAMKAYWTNATWEDLGRPRVGDNDRRAC